MTLSLDDTVIHIIRIVYCICTDFYILDTFIIKYINFKYMFTIKFLIIFSPLSPLEF
jgi:hypothetical protein